MSADRPNLPDRPGHRVTQREWREFLCRMRALNWLPRVPRKLRFKGKRAYWTQEELDAAKARVPELQKLFAD